MKNVWRLTSYDMKNQYYTCQEFYSNQKAGKEAFWNLVNAKRLDLLIRDDELPPLEETNGNALQMILRNRHNICLTRHNLFSKAGKFN